MEQGCSHWAWAISSGISHRSNMHEWEITTEWGAITSPKSVRVRWHYLAGWEPLLSQGSVAPKEWGQLYYCGGNRPFGPCLRHEDISLETKGLKCSKPMRHRAQQGSFVFNHQFTLQWRFLFTSTRPKLDNAEQKASAVGKARDDNLNQTFQGIKMPLCCRRHAGKVAIGNTYYVIMFFLVVLTTSGKGRSLKKISIFFDGVMWHFVLQAPRAEGRAAQKSDQSLPVEYPKPLSLFFQVIIKGETQFWTELAYGGPMSWVSCRVITKLDY